MQGVFDFTEFRNALFNNNSFDSMSLDENDNTYLHHIVQHYNEDRLPEGSALRSISDRHEDTELIIRRLVNKHSILDHQNIYGQTIYHLAARYSPPHILELLIELPGDFYSRDQEMDLDDVYGNSVAHYASADNVPILANHGFNINRKNFDGLTPLLDAVHKNHIQRACALLEAGAAPNCRDRNGNTVVHYCMTHHIIRRPILEAFINTCKTKFNVKNKEGFSPLDLAIMRRSTDMVKILWYTREFKTEDFDPWLESQELSKTFRDYLQTLRNCIRSTSSISGGII